MAGTGLRAIMTDFAIPDNPAELLSEQAGHWQVHEEASTTPWSLEQHAQRIANDAVAALCDDGAFSVAFSAINNFASLDSEAQAATVTLVVGIPMREGARRAACDLSAGMVGTVLRACKHVVQIGAADEAVARCRAALKAAVYLLSWLVQVAEKAHAEKAAGAVANPELIEQAPGAALCLCGGNPGHMPRRQRHVVEGRQVLEEMVELEHHADLAGGDLSGIRRVESGNHSQNGGLAGSRPSHQRDHLPGARVEVDAL